MSLPGAAIATQAGVPVILWGGPGSGKSSSIMAMGEALGIPCEVVIASIREPADFAGLPVINQVQRPPQNQDDLSVLETMPEVSLAPPAWARRLHRAGEGIAFFDEISTAPPATQAALLRVILDGVVGDLTLPEKVMIIAAANPPEQAAGGWDLSHPLANRFCHIAWTMKPDAWVQGMMEGFKVPRIPTLPANWTDGIQNARSMIAAFIKSRTQLLTVIPDNESEAGKAWPSPRSWDMASKVIAAAEAVRADEDLKNELVAGCVGEGAGLEFMSWLRNLDLPDPKMLLANPSKFKLSNRGDKNFAILASVATTAVDNLDNKTWMAAWEIMSLATKQGGADVAAVAAKTLAQAKGTRRDLQVPVDQIKPLIPILRSAGYTV